jgi:hypothetical protein
MIPEFAMRPWVTTMALTSSEGDCSLTADEGTARDAARRVAQGKRDISSFSVSHAFRSDRL